jgi:hypothetical protein
VATAATFGASIQMPATLSNGTLYTTAPAGLSGVGTFSSTDIARHSLPVASACQVSGYTVQVFGNSGAVTMRADLYFGPLSLLASNAVYGGPGGPVSCTVTIPAGTNFGSCTTASSTGLQAGWFVGSDLQISSGAAALQNAQVFVSFACQ